MKRSVIQLAEKTLVISLPSSWVQKNKIKKGDELELEENENFLKIMKTGKIPELKTEVDLTGFNNDISRRIVGALYKKGYDEIKIHYEDSKLLDLIQKEIDLGLIGYEIISNGKNSCNIKMVTKQNEENFDSMYRRIFFVLTSIGNEGAEILNPLDKNKLNEVIKKDKTVNKLADYCRRIINKSEQKDKVYNYSIAENLEKIGDEYRDMFKYIYENNFIIENSTVKLIKEVNKYLEDFHKLNFLFNAKEISELSLNKNKIRDQILKKIKGSEINEVVVLTYLDSIVKRIYDLNGILLQKNF